MLHVVIFLPLLFALVVLFVGRRAARVLAITGTLGTLVATLAIWIAFDPSRTETLQMQTRIPWIPGLGAAYEVGVDGLSLPLMLLTAVLFLGVTIYPLGRVTPTKLFLFLLMETGLMGLFASQDLLLFYLFFEVALVPMYFIIGVYGHASRLRAATKFFLYTRAGSLAMLLSFLALYLSMEPRTFSLPAIVEAQPLADGLFGKLALFGMLLGFGVKVPLVPIHNWLPDAHVEAPTEGSVILAGVQLKMGGYGLLRVAAPTLPGAVADWGWIIAAVALVSLLYGLLAALAQNDFKRLVAYTSIGHMAMVVLGFAVFGLSGDQTVRQIALDGATFQMVSHGLLTGGMFLMAGMLEERVRTRDMRRVGGLARRTPVWAGILAVLAFGSFGLPGMSGFIAEFQIAGATLAVSGWAAAILMLGIVVNTGLYLYVLIRLLFTPAPKDMPQMAALPRSKVAVAACLALLSIFIGIFPATILGVTEETTQAIARLVDGGG